MNSSEIEACNVSFFLCFANPMHYAVSSEAYVQVSVAKPTETCCFYSVHNCKTN